MSYFDEDSQAMLDVFLLETGQLLEKLEEILIEAEKNNSLEGEDINTIFRIMHTVKSSAAMMGLDSLSDVAHRLEDLFSELRDGSGPPGGNKRQLFEVLFEVADFIRDEMGRMRDENYEPSNMDRIQERIADYLTEENSGGGSEGEQEETPEERAFLSREGDFLHIRFEPGCRMENIRAFMLMRRLKSICPEAETLPARLENNPEAAEQIKQRGLLIRVEPGKAKAAQEALCGGAFVLSCEKLTPEWPEQKEQGQQYKDVPSAEAAEGDSRASSPPFQESEFVDVRVDRLDELQYLSGELLVMMSSFSNELQLKGQEELEEKYCRPVRQYLDELGNTVLNMRMVPISRILPKLRRVLRDICRDQQKEVELEAAGQDTEADKNIVDQLYEAAMHIVRNSVDHGIEPPGERRRLGKPEKGTVQLAAQSRGDELVVRISDDGRGMDIESLREKHLFTRPEEEYTEEEILDFCTVPGFTTNDEVNKYSGRGVGMDIVKKLALRAGGHLKIESAKGKGTSVIIYLPLTHTIVENILFKSGGHLFSMPFYQAERFFEYGEISQNIHTDHQGAKVLVYEDKVVPVIDVAKVYGLEAESTEKVVLYVKGSKREACLLADEVLGREKLLQKLLPKMLGAKFRSRTGMNGCCVMGDGGICMALDADSFIQCAVPETADEEESDGKWE